MRLQFKTNALFNQYLLNIHGRIRHMLQNRSISSDARVRDSSRSKMRVYVINTRAVNENSPVAILINPSTNTRTSLHAGGY